jgi:hypothetical protein
MSMQNIKDMKISIKVSCFSKYKCAETSVRTLLPNRPKIYILRMIKLLDRNRASRYNRNVSGSGNRNSQENKGMQNTSNAINKWLRPCSRCGKPTFSDLLDDEGICDYCREMRSMKTSVMRAGKRKNKK